MACVPMGLCAHGLVWPWLVCPWACVAMACVPMGLCAHGLCAYGLVCLWPVCPNDWGWAARFCPLNGKTMQDVNTTPHMNQEKGAVTYHMCLSGCKNYHRPMKYNIGPLSKHELINVSSLASDQPFCFLSRWHLLYGTNKYMLSSPIYTYPLKSLKGWFER